jgi:hypothetical protein
VWRGFFQAAALILSNTKPRIDFPKGALLFVKHFAAHWTDEERECFVPLHNQFVGKLLLYKRDVVKATEGRG